jgi:hypothetical protein
MFLVPRAVFGDAAHGIASQNKGVLETRFLILVPLAFLLPYRFGVWGIYMAEAISNLITTVVTHIAFSRYLKRLKQRFLDQTILFQKSGLVVI